MAAYFFVDVVEITDRAKLDEYRKHVPPLIAKFGGRYLVAGGKVDVVEGTWRPTFPVLIEFPNLAEARRWYDSEEYRELKAMRLEATRGSGVFFEGVAG